MFIFQTNLGADDFLMGKFVYYTYNNTDFQNFNEMYSYGGNAGFFKINMTVNAHPDSNAWGTVLRDMFHHKSKYIVKNLYNSYSVILPIKITDRNANVTVMLCNFLTIKLVSA